MWISASGPTTEFGVVCSYSITTDSSDLTFSNITTDGFTVSFEDDSGVSRKDNNLNLIPSVNYDINDYTFTLQTDVYYPVNTHFSFCPTDRTTGSRDDWVNEHFNLCTIAISLGITCPPASSTEYVCFGG